VPAYAMIVGVPGNQIGWMSEYGEKLDLPVTGEAEALCPHTKQQYQLKSGQVSIVE
jgi:UDP-2-acetamido-3-amino-2,3-dideoxy-glucuronate N-acetyltransferase